MKIAPRKTNISSKPKSHSNFGKEKKKSNTKQKYHTRSWKQLQTLATNALLGRLAPTPNNFEEQFHSLRIDDIRAILILKKTKQYKKINMLEEEYTENQVVSLASTGNPRSVRIITLDVQRGG